MRGCDREVSSLVTWMYGLGLGYAVSLFRQVKIGVENN